MTSLRIMGKEILLDDCPVLYDRPFTDDSFTADWQVRGGEWWVEDGWLTGRNPENSAGMLISRANFFGNVLLEFDARTVLPSTHDIDCMWNGSWNEETNARGVAYISGVEGWWEGKVGFERSPEYKLNVATQLFSFQPGRTYRIQTGSIDGHLFIFIDGCLALELTDPDPIDATRYGLIGFEAYASHMQIRRLIIRQIAWRQRQLSYAPEF